MNLERVERDRREPESNADDPEHELAVIFGAVGLRRRVYNGFRRAMAIWGLVLGVASFGLAVLWTAAWASAIDQVDKCGDAVVYDLQYGTNTSNEVCDYS